MEQSLNKFNAGGAIRLLNFLSWVQNSDYRIVTKKISGQGYQYLQQILNRMQKRLGTTQVGMDNVVLPSDLDGSMTIDIYADKIDAEAKPIIELEFNSNSQQWTIKKYSLNIFKDIEFFNPYETSIREKIKRITLTEELIEKCENIDDQYWIFEGINIYKDDRGYFTTCFQLDGKQTDSIATLLGLEIESNILSIREDVKDEFNLIINLGHDLGATYNDVLYKFINENITKLNDTNMVKKVRHNFISDYQFLGDDYIDFVQLPFNLNYIVSMPSDEDKPIIFVNISTGMSFRVCPVL